MLFSDNAKVELNLFGDVLPGCHAPTHAQWRPMNLAGSDSRASYVGLAVVQVNRYKAKT